MYTVYVLYSPKFKKSYTGFTASFATRFKSHNELATKGYTVKFRPWEVLITEVYHTKKEAILRERELKSGKGREIIRAIIQQKYFDNKPIQ